MASTGAEAAVSNEMGDLDGDSLIMTFDGKDYVKHAKGPGQVLDRFNASRGGHNLAMAAQ